MAVLQKLPFTTANIDIVYEAFVSAAELVDQWQTQQGVWYSFLDQSETGVDTSASAVIAAAFAWGAQLDILPNRYLRSAKSTYQTLEEYLAPDGFLTQVSQINRGGEVLQENGYRVISQFGMGLMGQLKAALNA